MLAGLFPMPRLRLVRGEGTYVWDDAGTKYLDFTAGLGVMALGHGRADLARVAQEQFTRLAHCSNLFVASGEVWFGQRQHVHRAGRRHVQHNIRCVCAWCAGRA